MIDPDEFVDLMWKEAETLYPLPHSKERRGERAQIGDGTPEGIAQVAFISGVNAAIRTFARPNNHEGISEDSISMAMALLGLAILDSLNEKLGQ